MKLLDIEDLFINKSGKEYIKIWSNNNKLMEELKNEFNSFYEYFTKRIVKYSFCDDFCKFKDEINNFIDETVNHYIELKNIDIRNKLFECNIISLLKDYILIDLRVYISENLDIIKPSNYHTTNIPFFNQNYEGFLHQRLIMERKFFKNQFK